MSLLSNSLLFPLVHSHPEVALYAILEQRMHIFSFQKLHPDRHSHLVRSLAPFDQSLFLDYPVTLFHHLSKVSVSFQVSPQKLFPDRETPFHLYFVGAEGDVDDACDRLVFDGGNFEDPSV